MKKLLLAALATTAFAGLSGAADAGPGLGTMRNAAPQAGGSLVLMRNAAQQFATLPEGVRYPEGITANPATGEVIVGTFDFDPAHPNKLLRFARNGQLAGKKDFGATPLLGLGFNPADGKVYILNMGASKVQRIEAQFTEGSTVVDVATVPGIGAPGNRTVDNPDSSTDTIAFGSNSFPAPNAMAFDASGNLYFSDSFQGAIFRIDNAAACTGACVPTTVAHDPLLATAGFPPFGANGIALNADESAMFIANTGDDRILRMDMGTKAISVFAESINGADGILFDASGRLWVAANQADEVVALNEQGRVIARLGEFQGIRNDGTPNGLLFPASLVIVGNEMFVTNLALPLTGSAGEWEADVTRWTVSRIKVPNR